MRNILTPQVESPLRQAVDPLGDLPPVMLVSDEPPGAMVTNYDIIHGEAAVGEATVVRSGFRNPGEQFLMRLIVSGDEVVRRSVGLATLVLVGERAHQEGDVARTAPMGEDLTSVLLWQTLVDRGVATVVNPYFKRARPTPTSDGRHVLHGHIRILPLVSSREVVELPRPRTA